MQAIQRVTVRVFMTGSYFEHPSEDELERFLMKQNQEEELERVETHILACDGCVARLEQLEVQMAAVKLALTELSREAKQAPVRRSAKDWFDIRTLSWAGAVAAVALAVSLTPHFWPKSIPAAEVSLSANRGSGVTSAPQGCPLHLHLSAQAIPNGPVRVVMVDGNGSELWKGTAQVRNDRVEVLTPKIANPGTDFVRLYALPSGDSPGDLLREYPLEVK